MKQTRSGIMYSLAAAGLALLLSACGGGGGSSSGSGSLSLGLTDGPVDNLEEVVVTFTEVIVHKAGGQDITFDMTEGGTTSGVSVDLKTLGQGNSIRLLNDETLSEGRYSWIRLVIDPDMTYVVEDTGGAQLLLDCSSCDESHLKLNRSFDIVAEGLVDFTIDFDLRKSISLQDPNNIPYTDYQYKLRPTLRIIDTQVASAYISGTVDQGLVDLSPAMYPDECSVYVYTGDASTVEPDDNCINDSDSTACPMADRPLTTADVMQDMDSGLYTYQTGYLYPGTYTVALLCEDDMAEVDDAVTFLGEAQVDAVAGDNVHPFVAPAGP